MVGRVVGREHGRESEEKERKGREGIGYDGRGKKRKRRMRQQKVDGSTKCHYLTYTVFSHI